MMDLTCEVCDSRFIDMDLCAGFRVVVCVSCKDTNSLYSLITKTQAKAEYLLTDEELADSSLVPSISRKNPHNPRWSDMRLYLRKQVRDFAICKFGSEEALQDALSSRTETRTDRKSQKFLKRLKGTVQRDASSPLIRIPLHRAPIKDTCGEEGDTDAKSIKEPHAHLFQWEMHILQSHNRTRRALISDTARLTHN